MPVPLLTQPLSVQLRERTAVAHENAEGSDFMADLLAGKADAQAYTELSAQLHFIYAALEAAARRHATGAHFSVIHDSRLERGKAVAADLACLLGVNWRERIEPLPATARYVARLADIDELGIIAHHYVRYLGDIAGGQVIAQMMRRLYQVDPEALNFYDFAQIGKIKPYRDLYRAKLDSLALAPEQSQAVVDEAIHAFALNSAVFAELAPRR